MDRQIVSISENNCYTITIYIMKIKLMLLLSHFRFAIKVMFVRLVIVGAVVSQSIDR